MKDWQREIQDGVRRERWSLRGPNSIVKVVPWGRTANALGGYITVGSALIGKSPAQIERALGLHQGYLAAGARIYRFTRLPLSHEFEYELTALHPGGLAFHPVHNSAYPEGDVAVHQWRIKNGVQIPVDARNFLELQPTQRFPYDWL